MSPNILTYFKFHNGGTVILLRATWVTSILVLAASIVVFDICVCDIVNDGKYTPEYDLQTIVQWYGVVFGSIYFGLYSRFASQWKYLADLFNKIKEVEVLVPDYDSRYHREKIAELKAAYIDDAINLHLATKKSFAPSIRRWGADYLVRSHFCQGIENERDKLTKTLDRIERFYVCGTRDTCGDKLALACTLIVLFLALYGGYELLTHVCD